MATRSRIGIARYDGSIQSIYCHWDGYPAHNGMLLVQHYTGWFKLNSLILLGDLSILGESIGEKHDFNTHGAEHPDWCLAYHRDRGEKLSPAVCHASQDAYSRYLVKESDVDYGYLWRDGEWWVYDVDGHRGWCQLGPLVLKILENTAAEAERAKAA